MTISPMPTAPRIAIILTGDAGVGVSVGHGVGTFTVDMAVVLTVVTVVWGTVVTVVSSGARTSDAVTYEVFPGVTVMLSE